MSTTSQTQQPACNHRALEVTTVLLGAVIVALIAVIVAVVSNANPLTAVSAGVSAFVSAFAVGIGAAAYVKHGS
ncbi:hypothetical protein [Streptomyces bobili]|uniref:Uncharacterized protein n=1 Tax=Streptomyces bobili TaxID=67280 RepID=A0ABZ1R486_9ACTN|nr:hypothetical protein [Streptomyces bobili]